MPHLTIYGSPGSRTMRVLWLAEELGLAFRHVPYAFDDPALKQPQFLRMNPNGAVPTIDDDGFALSESLAINPESYARPAGVEHNVVNHNDYEFVFVEIELK